jgi:hypothetical protein
MRDRSDQPQANELRVISINRSSFPELYQREENPMRDEIVTKFAQNLRGTLIRADNALYEEARKLYNGMIDKRPLMIARCVDVADVIAAVNFGRDNELLIAIRGGAHNGPGLGSCDDGLVIDLSMLKGVRVDPTARTVRVAPGCTQGDVDCRYRVDHRHRRPHAGRRKRIFDAPIRPHDR